MILYIIFTNIWISQFVLDLFLKLSFIEKNSWLFYGYLRTKAFVSGDLRAFYVMLWNIFFPRWHFPVFYGLCQKKNYLCQPWWWSLVNTSIISQFRENVSNFNVLANALQNFHLEIWECHWMILPISLGKHFFHKKFCTQWFSEQMTTKNCSR